ncbi:MAG: ATPase domain-containing protein [Thermoprotei archaeon]
MIIVKTGNEELDRRITGIPHPSTVIIEGEHGVGKTVFSGQLAYGFLQNNMSVLFVTTEALSYDLIVKLRGVKIDLVDAFLEDKFRVVPVNVRRFSWVSKQAENLLTRLLEYSRRIVVDCIVVDSLSLMASYVVERVLLDFIRHARQLQDVGKTVILTVHPTIFQESLLTQVRSMVDVYYRIKAVSIGGRRLKSLERIKTTGGFVSSDIVSIDIDPALGLRVVPLSISRG